MHAFFVHKLDSWRCPPSHQLCNRTPTGCGCRVGHTCFVLGASRVQNQRLFILTETFLAVSTQMLGKYLKWPFLIHFN